MISAEVCAPIEAGSSANRLTVRPELFASNGFLHAATVVALADSACGHGCMASLPDGASGFTTVELKSNCLGTAQQARTHEASVPAEGRYKRREVIFR